MELGSSHNSNSSVDYQSELHLLPPTMPTHSNMQASMHMRVPLVNEKCAEGRTTTTCIPRQKFFDSPFTMSSLPAVFMPRSPQRDLKPGDISSQSRSIVIPIRQQLHYIIVSLFILAWPWVTRALDERIASHYLSSFVKQCILCYASRALYSHRTIYQQIYCYILFVLITILASFTHLRFDPLFASESISPQELAIRLCLAYFIISEVEWWYKAREHVEHPTIGMFQLSWCHMGLSGMIAGIISWVLTCALGVEFSLFMVPWGSEGILMHTGTTLCVLVLLRPVHVLSVWLCETSWQELRDLQIGTWMVC